MIRCPKSVYIDFTLTINSMNHSDQSGAALRFKKLIFAEFKTTMTVNFERNLIKDLGD